MDEINILHFFQMGEIRAILFLPPHAPSTLANCYRMRIAQHTLAMGYRIRSIR